jgi:ParB family chromosome partitioning protein
MLATKPLGFFKTDPKQPRKHFTEADLRSLGESMLSLGQLQPVGAKPDGLLLWGERRFRAAQLVGMKELSVILTERSLSETEIRLIQLTENIHRSDLRDIEKTRACEELLRLNAGWTNKDLAAHLKLGESTITKYLAPLKCIAEVQEALESGALGITAAYEISRVAPEQQAEMLALKLSGTSRDALAQRVRSRKSQSKPQVRVKRIVCPLPKGISITLSGSELSLDESIEALGEAIREMKRARELGYTAKTFAAAMKDKAKKEGNETASA